MTKNETETNIGYLFHGNYDKPTRIQPVKIRHICLDQWEAFYRGAWREVIIAGNFCYIIFENVRIAIEIDGV